MNKRISQVLLSGCLIVTAVSSFAAQSMGPRVELSLIVTDKDNKALKTIRKNEVHVFEDKVEHTVLSIEPDERPVDLGLVIDASGSFRTVLEPALEAAKLIIVNRRPDDEIFIERFISSDKIQNLVEFTRDNNALLDSLNKFTLEGGQSAVIDALYAAVKHVSEHNNSAARRKAVVIITDGEDRNSFYKVEMLLKFLREQKVQVFAIGITTQLDNAPASIRASPRERAEKLLKTVTEESGGRVFFPTTKKELVDSMVQFIGDLRGQFRLTYQSSNSDTKAGLRKVEVKLSSADGEKRTAFVPRSYYVHD